MAQQLLFCAAGASFLYIVMQQTIVHFCVPQVVQSGLQKGGRRGSHLGAHVGPTSVLESEPKSTPLGLPTDLPSSDPQRAYLDSPPRLPS